MIAIVSTSLLININEFLTNSRASSYNISKLEGSFSSYPYYETDLEQITSIVVSLIKNHCFKDGNKRTALACLYILARENYLENFLLPESILKNNFIEIASKHLTVEESVKLLFFIK